MGNPKNFYALVIDQGATLTKVFTYKDENGSAINLTGYSARLKARPSYTHSSVLLDLTTVNSGITLGGSAGTITLNMSAEATSELAPGNGVYDLEIESGDGVVTRLIQGTLEIRAGVTK